MGILGRIAQQKAAFNNYRARSRASSIQRDSQKLQELETERSYQEIRGQQKAEIAAEKARITELKRSSSPLSGAINSIRGFQGRGVSKAGKKTLLGVAKQQTTSRPSLFAQNNFSEGYRGPDFNTPREKKKDPFGYRGIER